MVVYKSDSAVVRSFCCFSSSNRCTDFATLNSTYACCGHCFDSRSRISNCNSSCSRPCVTPRNSNSWFCSGLAKRLSFVMATTVRFGCTTCYRRAQSSTVSWLGDQLAVLSTRSVLKCDWNSSQFCITLVPFNMSPSRDEPRHINKKSSRCPSSREIPPSPQEVAG